MIKYLNLKDCLWSNTSKGALFVDQIVYDLWDEKILKTKQSPIEVFPLTCGEGIKTRKMKATLEDKLFEKGFSKDSTFIAIGGGTLIDLIGYLASTFCRGVPLILVPTTLLAMIDASIGGKNGLNTSFGKNLIGTIYEPLEVWIDPIFLSTLSYQQLQEGFMEMLKHALIFDANHFDEIAVLQNIPSLELIQKSIKIKQSFVFSDPYDQNRRQILNFGHTFAHGLEKLSHYQTSHGNAVAVGMLMESYLSYVEKDLPLSDFEKIYQTLMPIITKIPLQNYPVDEWEKALLMDKKNKENTISTVRLKKIGQAVYPKPISKAILRDVLHWFENACLCSR